VFIVSETLSHLSTTFPHGKTSDVFICFRYP
jgi:hypothetical protein